MSDVKPNLVVVPIKEMQREPNEKLIATLEETLRQAKTGEIQSHFAVYQYADDTVSYGWELRSGPFPTYRFIGGISVGLADFQGAVLLQDRYSRTRNTLFEQLENP